MPNPHIAIVHVAASTILVGVVETIATTFGAARPHPRIVHVLVALSTILVGVEVTIATTFVVSVVTGV
jgi:hypothetical protein